MSLSGSFCGHSRLPMKIVPGSTQRCPDNRRFQATSTASSGRSGSAAAVVSAFFLKLPARSSKYIISPASSEIRKEFYERPDVEFSVAEALLVRLLQNPNFQGDDDDRKQH
jgi:hypothetical protein